MNLLRNAFEASALTGAARGQGTRTEHEDEARVRDTIVKSVRREGWVEYLRESVLVRVSIRAKGLHPLEIYLRSLSLSPSHFIVPRVCVFSISSLRRRL